MYYSQAGQEEWIISETRGKKLGYFIDVGAYDGIKYSNTYFLEKELNWNGICIEADPNNYGLLIQNRKCNCQNIAVSDFTGKIKFNPSDMGGKIDKLGKVEIACDTLENILIKSGCPNTIDYLSVDIEGNEVEAIRNFPFNKWRINYITIEHNLYSEGDSRKKEIKKILEKYGYFLKKENVTHNNLPFEDWYSLI